MQPTVGRIVLYLPTATEAAVHEMGRGVRPAIITEVREDSVSLHVLWGDTSGHGGGVTIGVARQSVQPTSGCWHWPPRAPGS